MKPTRGSALLECTPELRRFWSASAAAALFLPRKLTTNQSYCAHGCGPSESETALPHSKTHSVHGGGTRRLTRRFWSAPAAAALFIPAGAHHDPEIKLLSGNTDQAPRVLRAGK